jgi:hypothetical protein
MKIGYSGYHVDFRGYPDYPIKDWRFSPGVFILRWDSVNLFTIYTNEQDFRRATSEQLQDLVKIIFMAKKIII